MANDFGVPYLGRLPLDPCLLKACEDGESYLEKFPTGVAVKPLTAIMQGVLDKCAAAAAAAAAAAPVGGATS